MIPAIYILVFILMLIGFLGFTVFVHHLQVKIWSDKSQREWPFVWLTLLASVSLECVWAVSVVAMGVYCYLGFLIAGV